MMLVDWCRRRRVQRAIAGAPRLADDPPSLPAHREWTPLVEAWWERLWMEGFARAYLESDYGALVRLALFLDGHVREPDPVTAAIALELAEGLALTPESRVALGWSDRPDSSGADVGPLLEMGAR